MAHVFLSEFNLGTSKNGVFKAGKFFVILKAGRTIFPGGVSRPGSPGKLQELGFGDWTAKRDDFEVTGVPLPAVRKFSRRRTDGKLKKGRGQSAASPIPR